MTLVRRLFATSFLVLVAAGPVSAETVPGQPAAPVAAPAPAIARVGVGSPAFVNALSLLVAGDAPAAYEAARHIPDNTERRAVQWAAIRFGKGVGRRIHFALCRGCARVRFRLGLPLAPRNRS